MDYHLPGMRLLQTRPVELIRHIQAILERVPQEFEGQSGDQTYWYGRTRRVLIIAEPAGVPAELFREWLQGDHLSLDFMKVYNREDLERVHGALSGGRYQLIVPTNLELSPFYIPELVSEVKRAHPSMKIAVVSGYDEREFVEDLEGRGIDDFIHVPPQADDLRRRIFQLLPGYSGKMLGASPLGEKRIVLVLSHHLSKCFEELFTSLGFDVVWADTKDGLERLVAPLNPDLAIEWQHSADDFSLRDMLWGLRKIPKMVLALNWSSKAPADIQNLGYAGALKVPFEMDELRRAFRAILPRDKQALLQQTQLWKEGGQAN